MVWVSGEGELGADFSSIATPTNRERYGDGILSLQSHNHLVCYPHFLGSKVFLAPVPGPELRAMADLEEQLSEQFQHDSFTFLEWFTAAKGTRLNPKLELADLRASAAGRG